ncbi:MAG: SPOR domain-containing protein [Rhodanobacter sp.]
MFLRLLFVLLCALNIVAGAWLLLGQPYSHVRGVTDRGVPELRLLSEMPDAGGTSSPPPPPPPATPVGQVAGAPPNYSCTTLGPFDTPQDLRDARQALGSQVARMRSRQEQIAQPGAWWVHLPGAATRAQALRQARQLGARNIADYFVVGSGDQANTVSLGLFRDRANARKRVNEVVAAGFPARMSERSENVPEYWLDLMIADGSRLDWHKYVSASGVGSHSAACF